MKTLYDHSEQTGTVITILLSNGATIPVQEEKAIEFAMSHYDYENECDMDDTELYNAASDKLDKDFDEVMENYYDKVVMGNKQATTIK